MILIVLFTFFCVINAQETAVRLNEKCNADSDCYNDWAVCDVSKKVCICLEGFKQDDHGCTAYSLYCPGTLKPDPMNSRLPKGPCESDRDTHNCTDKNDFCFIHSNTLTPDGHLFGHCCTKYTGQMATSCPTIPSFGTGCPTKTDPGTCVSPNKCYDDIPDSPNKACCPIACPDEGRNNQISIAGTGRCFVRKTYGDICEYTAECPNDAKCRPSSSLPSALVCQKD